ncbi:MAG: PAS domain S-box protein [Verrucomicrobia bacterium]|nr:PAS domain S-box protein [Verrucomicrobiota bacterium]
MPFPCHPSLAATFPGGFVGAAVLTAVLGSAAVWWVLVCRKRTRALRASERRYRELFLHSPVAILEIDTRETLATLRHLRATGVTDLSAWLATPSPAVTSLIQTVPIVEANTAALQLLGAKSAAEIRANLARILTPAAVELRRRALIELWQGQHVIEGETSLNSLDGTTRHTFQRWWVPIDRGTPIYERTQLALVDLTDKRTADAALAAERERLQVTLRAMSEAVVTVDAAETILFLNEAAATFTGWSAAEAMGRQLTEVCVLSSGANPVPIPTPVAAAIARDEPAELPPNSYLHARTDGVRQVEGSIAPVHGPDGRVAGAVLVIRDVTQRTRLEADLLRASKMESIGVLAGGIAHDFNNLLSIVMGNLTLAMLDERVMATGGRWLREAERGTLRAKELTQQLLTFARGGEPVRSAIRLAGVVREAAEFALHGSSVRCEFDLAEDLRPADADRGQIGQVVQNLVINAVQAMPGGGTLRVRLHNEAVAAGAVARLAPGDYLRLEIADTGTGISPEHLARIFEPFFTTKEHGTGLGLATVYSVIQRHGGHITVESAPGRGTTFRLWLPAARAVPDVAPVVPPTAPDQLRGRVLFMDDEEPLRVMTRELLERIGLEVVVTADGGEAVREYAIARLSGRPFDLVVFDLTVAGGMGGAEAMREILKIHPEAKGIVSSGYSSDPVMANFRAHGFLGSIPKPYRMADFARTIRAVLETS